MPTTTGRRRGYAPPAPAPEIFNGMLIRNTSEWGPTLWLVLHGLAEIKADPAMWNPILTALQTSIPCPECTGHYTAWLAAHPLDTTGGSIRRWLLDLHNDVNRRRGVGLWEESQLAGAYGGATLTDLATRAEGLRGIIGTPVLDLLAAATVAP